VKANDVDKIVTVIQSSVEEVVLPIEEDGLDVQPLQDGEEGGESFRCVDIIVSEWMGYMLLRESMLDSVIRARDKFLKKRTGLMFPSHTTMLLAPVVDEQERKTSQGEFASAMSDWEDFASTTSQVYGVDMDVLKGSYEKEQKEYFLLSSKWTELPPEAVLAEPTVVKQLDMAICTVEDARGIPSAFPAEFDFDMDGDHAEGPVSGLAGWFTADFRSRTDSEGVDAPKLLHPSFLSTGPENGYTHWGQQTFYFLSSIPLFKGETTRLFGTLEMMRTKENSRLYNCRITYRSSRRRSDEPKDGTVLMKSNRYVQVYQIP